MSGGSLDYGYCKVEEMARSIVERSRVPLHIAFAKHLLKVSTALHDLEWLLSSDTSPGDEKKAIMDVITKRDVVDSAIEEARKVLKDLQEAIKQCKT